MLRRGVRQFLPLILGLLGLVVVVLAVPEAVRYFGKARGETANLVINFEGVLGIMPRPWRNLAQGGEEAKPMLGGVIEEVKVLQPEYIRIDHIYDGYKVVEKQGESLVYDWSRLDKAVDEIMATGAKPFLSLSYMPLAISRGDIVDLPTDFSQWGEVVLATIEHFSGREGRNIDGVIYEVWNEPDLFGGYKVRGAKNYLELYEAAARAAGRAKNVNRFEIGGPATTALYQNWVQSLIKYVSKNGLKMDFLSWHRYSTDIDQFETDVKEARKFAERIPALARLKYYLTEWGHNSENDSGYDGSLGAVHLLAATRSMVAWVDRAFVFEIKDGPGEKKYWGRWGLLTHEKFGQVEKKPRYRAMEFLNSLLKFRLSLEGEGSFVRGIASTDETGKVRALIVNYDQNGKHAEAVPITFENLPQGSFTYKREDFMGESQAKKVATSEAVWKTTEFLGPNKAMIISVEF